jgi:hypothetical protein
MTNFNKPRATPEDEAFNDVERMSRVKQEIVKMTRDGEKLLNADRNKVIEEVAQHIEKLRGFGQDTISSLGNLYQGDEEMTDKELLELASKAININVVWNEKLQSFVYFAFSNCPKPMVWNPLIYDADALRLAVKLEIAYVCIDTPHEGEPHSHVIGFSIDHNSTTVDAIEHHGDPYAATRRAIVRAAAEIGKATGEQACSNPPAFPKAGLNPWNRSMEINEGMTLRDYFAAKALQNFSRPDWLSI